MVETSYIALGPSATTAETTKAVGVSSPLQASQVHPLEGLQATPQLHRDAVNEDVHPETHTLAVGCPRYLMLLEHPPPFKTKSPQNCARRAHRWPHPRCCSAMARKA